MPGQFQKEQNCALFGYDAVFFSCPVFQLHAFTTSGISRKYTKIAQSVLSANAQSIAYVEVVSSDHDATLSPVVLACLKLFWHVLRGHVADWVPNPGIDTKQTPAPLARQSSFMPSWRHLQTQGEAEARDGIQKQCSTMHHWIPKHSKALQSTPKPDRPALSISASLESGGALRGKSLHQAWWVEVCWLREDREVCDYQVYQVTMAIWIYLTWCCYSFEAARIRACDLMRAHEVVVPGWTPSPAQLYCTSSRMTSFGFGCVLFDFWAEQGSGHQGPLKVISGTTATVLLARLWWWVVVSYCHIILLLLLYRSYRSYRSYQYCLQTVQSTELKIVCKCLQ